MGSCIDFSSRLTMKVLGSLLLLSAATAEAQFGILGDLLGLGSHDAREIEGPSNSNCSYYCSNNGGCVVNYVGPSRPGKTSGSCFPHSYGGECSGTPPECSNCNNVLTCHEPGQREEERGRPPVEARGDVCDYSCQPSGSCIVKYVGPPRGGNTAGSCFPHSYGGGCSGTPRECEDCNSVLTCHEPGVRNHKVSSPSRRDVSKLTSSSSLEFPYHLLLQDGEGELLSRKFLL